MEALSKNLILGDLQLQENILIHYGINPDNKKGQNNPLTGGSDSLVVRIRNNKYQITDFSGGNLGMDVIGLVQEIESQTFTEALTTIADLSNLTFTAKERKPKARKAAKPKAVYTTLSKPLSKEEIDYLQDATGQVLKESVLNKYAVSIKEFKNSDGFKAVNQKYVFGFPHDNGFKIYSPNPLYQIFGNKSFWMNKIEGSFFCLGLEDIIEGRPVIFTEGEKDFLVLKSLGFNAITFGGVSSISKKNIKEVKKRLEGKNITSYYSLFDNDSAGLDASKKGPELGFTPLFLPSKLEGKDISDYTKAFGFDNDFKAVLKPLIELDTYYIDKYIGEVKGLSERLTSNNKPTILHSSTGTGKTTLASDIIKSNPTRPCVVVAPQKSLADQFKKDLEKKGVKALVLNEDVRGDERVEAINSMVLITTLQSLNQWNLIADNPIIFIDEIDTFSTWEGINIKRTLTKLMARTDCSIIGMTGTPIIEVQSVFDCDVIDIKLKSNRTHFKGINWHHYNESDRFQVMASKLSNGGLKGVFLQDKILADEIGKQFNCLVIHSDIDRTGLEYQRLMETGLLERSVIVTSTAIRGINILNDEDVELIAFEDVNIDADQLAQFIHRPRLAKTFLSYFTKENEKEFTAKNQKKFKTYLSSITNSAKLSGIYDHNPNCPIGRFIDDGKVLNLAVYEFWKTEVYEKDNPFFVKLKRALKQNSMDSTISFKGEIEIESDSKEKAVILRGETKLVREQNKDVKKEIINELGVNTSLFLDSCLSIFPNNKTIDRNVKKYSHIPNTIEAITDYIEAKKHLFTRHVPELIERFVGLIPYVNEAILISESMKLETDKQAIKIYKNQALFDSQLQNGATKQHEDFFESHKKFKRFVSKQSSRSNELRLFPLLGKSWDGTVASYYKKAGVLGDVKKVNILKLLRLTFRFKEVKTGNNILGIKNVRLINSRCKYSILGVEKPNEIGTRKHESCHNPSKQNPSFISIGAS